MMYVETFSIGDIYHADLASFYCTVYIPSFVSYLYVAPIRFETCPIIQALEPSISKEIMTLHHTKHHQTYVNGLNAAEESLAKFSSEGDVKSQIGLQAALKFNGGGHM
jgi:hypothetical protein